MGLETVHPQAFPRLNKGMALEDFGRAAERLRDMGVLVRAFVLVGAPFVPPEEAVDWAVRSVEHALAAGASTVALIPVRGGHGALDELAVRGAFTPPRLEQLEEALERSLAGPRGTGRARARRGDRRPVGPRALRRLPGLPAGAPGPARAGQRDRMLRRRRGLGEAGTSGGAAGCPECGWDGGRP